MQDLTHDWKEQGSNPAKRPLNTHRVHIMAGLQFKLFGFDQQRKYVVILNPNQSSGRPGMQ